RRQLWRSAPRLTSATVGLPWGTGIRENWTKVPHTKCAAGRRTRSIHGRFRREVLVTTQTQERLTPGPRPELPRHVVRRRPPPARTRPWWIPRRGAPAQTVMRLSRAFPPPRER